MNTNDKSNILPIGEMITKLLLMLNVPKHKHGAHIAKVLNVSSTHANRKLKKDSLWDVNQLEIVLDSLGFSLSKFFSVFENGISEMHDAIFEINKTEHTCKIFLSEENDDKEREFSAVKINDKWHVFLTTELTESTIKELKRKIILIEINSRNQETRKKRIALLDDDLSIVDSLKDILSNRDYLIDTFNEIESLENEIKKKPYDAYVLDWLINDMSVYKTIKLIRETANPNALIIALTGQLGGKVDAEIADAINDFDISGPYEKPIRLSVIKMVINKYFTK